MDHLAHRKETVVRFQQGRGEDPHTVEEVEVAVLHSEHGRLVHDAAQCLGPRLLVHDLAGERGRTPEEVPVFPGDADPCHLDDDRRDGLLAQGLVLDLAYQAHEAGRVFLADEPPLDQDGVALKQQGILCLVRPGKFLYRWYVPDDFIKVVLLAEVGHRLVYQRVSDIDLQCGKDVLADESGLVTPDTFLDQADTGIEKLGIDPLGGGAGLLHDLDCVVEVAHPGECVGDLPVELSRLRNIAGFVDQRRDIKEDGRVAALLDDRNAGEDDLLDGELGLHRAPGVELKRLLQVPSLPAALRFLQEFEDKGLACPGFLVVEPEQSGVDLFLVPLAVEEVLGQDREDLGEPLFRDPGERVYDLLDIGDLLLQRRLPGGVHDVGDRVGAPDLLVDLGGA